MPDYGLGLGGLGSMPLGGYEHSTQGQANSAAPRVFRRLWVKRRSATTGQFEANWQNVSQYVESWGQVAQQIDDSKLFRIRHMGLSVKVRNDEGTFNHHSNASSLWFGYMTRGRSMLKVEAGYLDTDGFELPVNPIQGIFIMDDELSKSAEDDAVAIQSSSLQGVFEGVKAKEIPSLNVTMTAETLFGKIRDHTDGAGVAIFQQYISSTAWSIASTSNYYIFPTDTVLEDQSIWEVMESIAEAENMVVLVNRSGGLELRSRAARTTTSQWDFLGQGSREQNVIALTEEKEAIFKAFASFRLKHIDADTFTSYVTAGTTTTVSPSSVPWQNGNKGYEFENFYVTNTATAQSIVTTLQSNFSAVKTEYEVEAIFAPELELLDAATLTYFSYDLANSPLWDVEAWDDFNWASDGENFNLDAVSVTVLSKSLDLDKFSQRIRLRRE